MNVLIGFVKEDRERVYCYNLPKGLFILAKALLNRTLDKVDFEGKDIFAVVKESELVDN